MKLNEQLETEIRDSFEKICESKLGEALVQIRTIAIAPVVNQCAEILSNSISVILTYTKTAKKVASKHSFFVPNILANVK